MVSKKSRKLDFKSQAALQDCENHWTEPNPASEYKTKKGKLSQEQRAAPSMSVSHWRGQHTRGGLAWPVGPSSLPTPTSPVPGTVNALGRAPASREPTAGPEKTGPGRPAHSTERRGEADPMSKGWRCLQKSAPPARVRKATERK